MKRYSIPMLAGVPVEIDHPGRFFTLLGCITPVDVSLQAAALRSEVLESITPGIWCDFGEDPFSRVRIVSPADQTVTFLVSMVRSGWAVPSPSCQVVRVDLSDLAASAMATSTVIDLGDEWASCVVNLQAELTASAGGSMSLWCSDTVVMFEKRMCIGQGYQGVGFTNTSTSNHHLSSLRATGRYLQAQFNNGATQQAAGRRLMMSIMRNVTA